MGPQRPGKRVRPDESFFEQGRDDENSGSYLRLKLISGQPLRSKGWPWVQVGVRGVLGSVERLEKANFLGDGTLLIKTKNAKQTEKFLKIQRFANEECEVTHDRKLNTSRGTIRAYDLEDLTEDEVVGWLKDFGVVRAKRFTRRENGKVCSTPTILLTFDRPSCPTKLQLDYVTYHVQRYIPNPMMCYRCGKFGHPEGTDEKGCKKPRICLRCGQSPHEGICDQRCANCGKSDHSCQARTCEEWVKEKAICRIKVEQEVSFAQAKQQYEAQHDPPPPVLRAYAATVRANSVTKQDDELKEKVEKLEKKVGELVTLLQQLLAKQTVPDLPKPTDNSCTSANKENGEPEREKTADECVDDSFCDEMTGEELPLSTQEGCADQHGDWQTAGRGRTGREKHKTQTPTTMTTDDVTPSSIITRASSLPPKVNNKTATKKKSWKGT